jgi:beta-phosphoglucomutase
MRFIISSKMQGIKTCIASTASRENLYNVLNHFNITNYFDIIITGENVTHGKPNPEVYNMALTLLDCEPDEALAFEDSDVGCEAAEGAEINYIKVKLI